MNNIAVANSRHPIELSEAMRYGLEGDDEPSVDIAATFRQIWAAAYRNRVLIAGIVAGVLALGVLATLLMTPKYQATASVQIDQQATKVLGTEDPEPDAAAYQDADRFLQTQVDVLKSRSLAEQVATSLNLDAGDRFATAMGAKPLDRPIGALNLQKSKHDQVLDLLEKNLDIELTRNSRVVAINFKSRDASLAAQVANSFASNFITMNLRRKYDQSSYARDFLQQQLGAAKQRLQDSEVAMLQYSRTVGLIDASAGIGTPDQGGAANAPRSLVTSDLVAINTAYAAAQANRVQAQQRWEQARSTPMLQLPEVLNNPAVQQLLQLKVQYQAAYDQDLTRHKPDYPALKQLAAQIAGYDDQINKIGATIRSAIHDQYVTASKQESALDASVSGLKNDTLQEQEKSVRYNILKREADTNRTMYDGLLQRYKEVSAESGITTNNISIVDNADVPAKPVSPKLILNLAGATLLGFMLAAATVFIREKFDDAVRSPDDVQTKLDLPLLNTIPLIDNAKELGEELDDPRSPLSEAYAALRTSLELAGGAGLAKSLLFTSSRSGEGKSTSALAIARDFAKLGRTVILIDGDLRRPSLHRTVGIPNNVGLSQLLAGREELSAVVRPGGINNLSIMTSGPHSPNPAELLSSPVLRAAFGQLQSMFDLVIVDGPPVMGLADAVILANSVDRLVFVVEANGAHHGAAKSALRRLRAASVPILGAILTKFDAKKLGYGYSYGYYTYNYGAQDD